MVEIHGDNIAYFDCDETLVFVDSIPDGVEIVWLQIPGFPGKEVGVHHKHVERLKNHKIWGNTVVVWSKSGHKWAKSVVEALQLNEYVDLVITKPSYVYDDKMPDKILSEHRFLNL